MDIFGEVYAWKDYDGDGIDDMIIVTTDWIDFNTSKVYLVKGDSGSIIWRRPLNGELSYPAPAKQNDFNTDGVCDFVIEANNRSQNKGTIFMLDGNDGAVIWSKTYTGRIHTCWGPSYSEDFNRDGFKDIIVVTRNQEHNIGKLFILKGNDGSVIWDKSYDLPLRVFPIDDINRDGIKDIIVESKGIEALDGVDASQIWNNPLNPLMVYVDLAYDLNEDNKEDLVVVNTTENGLNKYMYTVTALSGVNSDKIWSSSFFHNLSINTSESLNEWPDIITRRSHDLTGDGIDDVILQLRYYSYYPITYSEGKVILISGKDGSEVCSAESTLDDHNVNIWVSMLDLNNDGINDLLIRTCKGVYAVSVAMNDG
ncbi:MAG: PQQ-binding-like beta-propeller repeat protein [Methanophagales archaeon]|nr:PQQ-binding-like beta-propeller repeat protein [Methanophagales archaeon]